MRMVVTVLGRVLHTTTYVQARGELRGQLATGRTGPEKAAASVHPRGRCRHFPGSHAGGPTEHQPCSPAHWSPCHQTHSGSLPKCLSTPVAEGLGQPDRWGGHLPAAPVWPVDERLAAGEQLGRPWDLGASHTHPWAPAASHQSLVPVGLAPTGSGGARGLLEGTELLQTRMPVCQTETRLQPEQHQALNTSRERWLPGSFSPPHLAGSSSHSQAWLSSWHPQCEDPQGPTSVPHVSDVETESPFGWHVPSWYDTGAALGRTGVPGSQAASPPWRLPGAGLRGGSDDRVGSAGGPHLAPDQLIRGPQEEREQSPGCPHGCRGS